MDSSIDKTRSHLRKRLDQMGYRLHFGMDSVPLVAKLLSDLVHTTISLRDAKLSAAKAEGSRKSSVSSELPYMTVLGHQLASGDHFISTGGRKTSNILVHQSTQTNDVRPHQPHGDDELLSQRLLELQEELVALKSELDLSERRAKALGRQLAEAQEAKRTLERSLERTRLEEAARQDSRHREARGELSLKDEALSQALTLKERVLNMAYRKLSASKELVLGQQEVIRDLEDNLGKMKAEACRQSRLRDSLDEARGRNRKLEQALAFLEADKNALQDKVDHMMANERDQALALDLGGGDGGGPARRLAAVVESLEEERDRYRREARHYKSLLRAAPSTPPAAQTACSPTRTGRNERLLAASFQGGAR